MAWARKGTPFRYAVPEANGFSDEPMPKPMPEFTEESLVNDLSAFDGFHDEDAYVKPPAAAAVSGSTGSTTYVSEHMLADDICNRIGIVQRAIHAEFLADVGAKLKAQEASVRNIVTESISALRPGTMESCKPGPGTPAELVEAELSGVTETTGRPRTPTRQSVRSCQTVQTVQTVLPNQPKPQLIGGRSQSWKPSSWMDGSRRRSMSPAMIDQQRRKAATALARCSVSKVLDVDDFPTRHRSRLQAFIASRGFELCVFFMIASNVILVGMETDFDATHSMDVSGAMEYRIADYMYTSFFLAELLLRMVSEGREFFASQRNWAWNLFDFLVVMSSLTETVLSLLREFASGMDIKHMRILRAVRVVRLTRAFRMVRLVKFIRSLRTLILSILVTLRSLVWALLLLVMIFFGFGIALTQAVTSYRINAAETGEEDPALFTLEVFWGTVPRSMFTLLKAMTGGISWHQVVEPLAVVSSTSVTIFIAYIVFNVFAVMNVITGAFCQSAIEAAQNDKEFATSELLANKKQFIEDMQGLFATIDSNNSGMIDVQEFESHLSDEKLRACFSLLDIDTNDAWTLFKLLDGDETGEIDVSEFVSGCLELRGHAKAIHVAKMSQEHSLFRQQVLEMVEQVTSQLAVLTAWAGVPEQQGADTVSNAHTCASGAH